MKTLVTAVAAAAVLALSGAPAHAQAAHEAAVKAYVDANVKSWLSDPTLVKAIVAQNAKTSKLTQADIDAADKAWRAETAAKAGPTIDPVAASPASTFLKKKKADSKGVISEVFAMDAKGLNVAMSDVTSDYWQGDEPKWQKTYPVGAGAVFVDAVKKDESTQALQSQVSLTIVDSAGKPAGAITIGLNMNALK